MVNNEQLMVLNCGVGQDSWESLGLQGDPPSHPKGNQSWIFIGRTDAEIEPPILWPPDVKSRHWKRSWFWARLKAGGEGEDRGWDGWMESPTRWTWVAQAPGVGEEQWTLVFCSPWGCKESDMTERLNWTYHIANTICNWHVFPAILGLSRPQQISPIKFAPMHRSQCLAFTRHSVSSDCRRTSILVDIKE